MAIFRNFWYLLVTPATFLIFCTFLQILVHIGNFCHNVILSSHPVSSSCHLFLSSCLLVIWAACQFVILSICQLVSFSACASWSLRACRTHPSVHVSWQECIFYLDRSVYFTSQGCLIFLMRVYISLDRGKKQGVRELNFFRN